MKPLGNLINSVAMKLGVNLCKTSYRSSYQAAEMVRSIVHSTSEHVFCKDELKACIITETIIGGCVFSLIPRFFQSHSQAPPWLSATKLEKSLGIRMIYLHILHVPIAVTAISGWHCRWAVRGITLPGGGLLEPGGSSPDVLLTNCDIHCSTGTACVCAHVSCSSGRQYR